MKQEKYNGWKNRATWNVALWIGNDQGLYNAARDFMKHYRGHAPYKHFIAHMDLLYEQTPDQCAWFDPKLGYAELNSMMREL